MSTIQQVPELSTAETITAESDLLKAVERIQILRLGLAQSGGHGFSGADASSTDADEKGEPTSIAPSES
ncbi:MAG: hypothetical protein LPK08_07790 [Halomonas sp.]|nr:hypothetical protein [Halomonas sp.]